MISPLALLCVLALAALGEATALEYLAFMHQNEDNTITPFSMPINKVGVEVRNWEQIDMPSNMPAEHTSGMTMWSNKQGHSVSLMLDSDGNVTGFHLAINSAVLSDNKFDTTTQGYYTWPSTVNGTSVNYIATFVIFKLSENKIIYSGINGEVKVISFNIADNTEFTEQNCVDGKGKHYFLKLSAETECTSDSIFTFYVIVNDEGKIIGCGIYLVAKQTVQEGTWTWWVNWPAAVVQNDLRAYPTCLSELANNPGIIGLEWLLEDRTSYTCPSS